MSSKLYRAFFAQSMKLITKKFLPLIYYHPYLNTSTHFNDFVPLLNYLCILSTAITMDAVPEKNQADPNYLSF